MILMKTLKKYAFNESTSLGYFTQDQHISYYYDSYNSERFQIFEVYEEPLYGKTFFFFIHILVIELIFITNSRFLKVCISLLHKTCVEIKDKFTKSCFK